jgi:glycosyltransferase involved in cell wall biosynthesis
MKIVFLGKYNETEILTGPEKVAKRIFGEVVKTNEDTVFIDYYFKRIRKSNLYLRLFGKDVISQSPKIMRLGIKRLFLFLMKFRPDIIHIITTERFTLSIFLYKFLLKGKIVTTLHGIIKYEIKAAITKRSLLSNFKDLLLELVVIKFSDSLVFLSAQQLNLVKSLYKIDNKKVIILPNGGDKIFLNQNKIFEKNSTFKTVFYNSSYHDIKGFTDFVSILNMVNTEKEIEVHILGAVPQNLIPKKNIKFITVSPMNSQELAEYLKDKHCYFNTSKFETFSLLTLECMIAGLIVFVTDKAGISSYIKNYYNGFTYNEKNINELVFTLQEVIEGKVDLNVISNNAVKLIDTLNWQKVTNMYLDLYKTIS